MPESQSLIDLKQYELRGVCNTNASYLLDIFYDHRLFSINCIQFLFLSLPFQLCTQLSELFSQRILRPGTLQYQGHLKKIVSFIVRKLNNREK